MTIKEIILNSFNESFTLNDAYKAVNKKIEVKQASIRARIYEAIDDGILKRISKGVYQNNNCLIIHGDGRNLSFINDDSIDAIITDHPYDIKKSNKALWFQ